jgi:hypothetical protein
MVKKVLLISLVCMAVIAFMVGQATAGCMPPPFQFVCADWITKGLEERVEVEGNVEGETVETTLKSPDGCSEIPIDIFCSPPAGNGGGGGMALLQNNYSNSSDADELECLKEAGGAAQVLVIEGNSLPDGMLDGASKRVGNREQLPSVKSAIGETITLEVKTGRVGNRCDGFEWYAFWKNPPKKSWERGGPSDNGLQNYVGVDGEVGAGLGKNTFSQWKLPFSPIIPLGQEQVEDLENTKICAVVRARNIYAYSTRWYGSRGNLWGKYWGLMAINVTRVNPLNGDSSLVEVVGQIVDTDRACQELALYTSAPEDQGVCEVVEDVPITIPEGEIPLTGSFEPGSYDPELDLTTTTLPVELSPEAIQEANAQCEQLVGPGSVLVDFNIAAFCHETTTTAAPGGFLIEDCQLINGIYECVGVAECPTCEPEPVSECEGQVYPFQDSCNVPQPEDGCINPVCISTPEELGFCVEGSTPCLGLAPCLASTDCAEGEVCAIGTFCTYPDHLNGVCIPADAFCPPAEVIEAVAPKAAAPKAAAPEAGPTIGGP